MPQLPPLLILDDDDDDVFIARRLLAKAGVQNKAVTFQEPLVAISYLEAEIRSQHELMIPFLIITDLNMPTMSGFEFAQWVRAQPALDKSYLVMLTTSEVVADKAKALSLGVNQFLSKYPTAASFGEIARMAGAKIVDVPSGSRPAPDAT